MAISLLSHVISDLCLGKPALRSLSKSASIADALYALNHSEENFISIWNCDCDNNNTCSLINTISTTTISATDIQSPKKNISDKTKTFKECECIGKVSMADIICYLCKDENLTCLSSALDSPVCVIFPPLKHGAAHSEFVKHVQPSTSLLEAMDLMLQGAHNLVVPIQTSKYYTTTTTSTEINSSIHNDIHEYCWLTQEDMIRFILNRIGFFTPIPALSLESLAIIRKDILVTIDYNAPASSALDQISKALAEQTSVALIDEDGVLVSEISPSGILSCCDETIGPAIMTLSCGDLVAYIDNWGGPPDDLVRIVQSRLREQNLEFLLELLDDDDVVHNLNSSANSTVSSSLSSASSVASDDETTSSCLSSSPISCSRSSSSNGGFSRSLSSRRHNRSGSYSAQVARRAEGIACHPGSSLVAVMIQAIAHRVNYAWVVEDDGTLVGIVTFFDMLKVFRNELETMVEWEADRE